MRLKVFTFLHRMSKQKLFPLHIHIFTEYFTEMTSDDANFVGLKIEQFKKHQAEVDFSVLKPL